MKFSPRTLRTISRGLSLLVLGALLVTPLSAVAERLWTQGTTANTFAPTAITNVTITTVDGAPAATLQRKVLWQYGGAGDLFAPSWSDFLSNGSVVIADPTAASVTEVSHAKKIVWSYTSADNPELSKPSQVQRLSSGNTLIVDRSGDFVIEVNKSKQVVWKYGAQKGSTEAGSLKGIYSATRLSNGNTLIVDRAGTRVIEVRTGDYNADSPTLGFTSDSIVWRYGVDSNPSSAAGRLVAPKTALRLSNGNTLIVDAANSTSDTQRVLEVTHGGSVAWKFTSGSSVPSGVKPLAKPAAAVRLYNGHTLIAEEGSDGRIFELDSKGKYVGTLSVKGFLGSGAASSKLGSMMRSSSGSILIADEANRRIIEVGYPSSGSFESGQMDLTLPGVSKKIIKISVTATKPKGTSVSLQYSLNGGAWKGSGTSITLPANTMASLLKYRVKMSTTKADATPVVRKVTVSYDLPTSVSTGSGSYSYGQGGTGTGLGFGTGYGTGYGLGSGIGTGTVGLPGLDASGSPLATGTAGIDTSVPPMAATPTGPRFTQGTLLEASNQGAPAMRGSVGGLVSKEQAPIALLFVGLSYGIGVSGGWIGRGAQSLVRLGFSMFGRR